MRENIHLACGKCTRRNYHTTKNKKTHPEKFEVVKFCKFCREHTAHKEAKL
jgi:large subunit ribosomal protein L33